MEQMEEKNQSELSAWKELCEKLCQTIEGQSDEIHRLSDENIRLEWEVEDLKSRKLRFAWVFSLLSFLLSAAAIISAATLAR